MGCNCSLPPVSVLARLAATMRSVVAPATYDVASFHLFIGAGKGGVARARRKMQYPLHEQSHTYLARTVLVAESVSDQSLTTS